MRLSLAVVTFLISSALMSACGTWTVVDLEETLVDHERVPAPAERTALALVVPFEDQREPEFTMNEGWKIPVLGLMTMFLGTRHPFPEITKPTISSVALMNRTYMSGDFSEVLPAVLADRLRQSGIFKDVKYLRNADQNFDPRRYDYVVQGHLISADLTVRNYDYGLNFFNLVDLSFMPKLLGFPDESYRAELVWQVEVLHRDTGDSVFSRRVAWGPEGKLAGYYYGRQVDGLPANAGLYHALIEDNMDALLEDIRGALKDTSTTTASSTF